MNPWFLTFTAALQVALLADHSEPTPAALLYGVVLVAIFALFAFTREHWPAHIDMILIMTGPGGAAMLMVPQPAACHITAAGFWMMSAAMIVVSVPLCWRYSRCVRQNGYNPRLLAMDVVGMELGMALAHLLPHGDAWLHHAVMLTAMNLGMTFTSRAVVRSANP